MPVIRSSSTWQPVKYDAETAAVDGEFQFLSAFEELNDYELDGKNIKTKAKKPDKKRKREMSGSKLDERRPSKTKSKKKRKVKKTEDGKAAEPMAVKVEDADVEMEDGDSFDLDMSSWDSLFIPEPVLHALRSMRFQEPTEIQKLAMPAAIRDRLDILGAAETGSGKTLAFGIPIIAGLLADVSSKGDADDGIVGPKALILSPTRELALQIKQHMTAVLKYTDIKVACVVGGLSVQKQQRLLKKLPEILIATPGRLWALIQEEFEFVRDLYLTVRYLAIDETDRMVEKGHFVELQSILDFLKKDPESAQKRQTFVFSATLTYVHPPPKRLVTAKQAKHMTPEDKIDLLVSLTGLRKQRIVIDITRRFGTAEGLTETRLNCANLLEKDTYLYYFLTNYSGRTLIFTNSIDCARRLRSLLTHLRLDPLILHAQMHQKQRFKNLERFSEKEGTVLLATDVASRGLDIKNIEHVIHYQVPRTPEIYVHRSGRTARANREGLSIMLVDKMDVSHYRRICRNLNRDKDLDVFPIDSKTVQLAKERVQLATQLESAEHQTKRDEAREKWFERAAKEAELDDDDDDENEKRSRKFDEEGTVDKRKQLQSLKKRLNALLDMPIKGRAPVTKYPTAYQVDVPALTAAGSSHRPKPAIEAVSQAKEEGKRLFKKLGAKKIGRRMKKGKRKGREMA